MELLIFEVEFASKKWKLGWTWEIQGAPEYFNLDQPFIWKDNILHYTMTENSGENSG